MSERARRESPWAEFYPAERSAVLSGQAGQAGVQLQERPFLGHLNLRGEPTDTAFLEAVEAVVGFSLPLDPNTVTDGREVTALWLGPNEWLLLTPEDQQDRIAQALRTALGNVFSAVTDLSGGQTVINIRGTHARDVLSKGSPVDLHARVFGPGRCTQTHLAKAGVLIRHRGNSPSFDLMVRRSFADYVATWLKNAAEEYGVVVISQPTDSAAVPASDAPPRGLKSAT